MAKCCQTNNCVEIEPSGCVKYTGTPTTGGLIDKQDYCDPYLNDIIKLLDDNLTTLDTRVGLNKTALDNANTACGINSLMDLSNATVKDEKYYSAEVVIKLVGVICELRSRINYLTSKDINTNLGNLHWEDMPLSPEFLTWLDLNACITFGKADCVPGEEYAKTLGGLLKVIINKLCCVISQTNTTC
jgi:hypothetical protein